MSNTETYGVTALGLEIAQDIYNRFENGDETIEQIAASHGMEVEMVQILMAMVFAGGSITVDIEGDPDEDIDLGNL
jgi:hypothetical protein